MLCRTFYHIDILEKYSHFLLRSFGKIFQFAIGEKYIYPRFRGNKMKTWFYSKTRIVLFVKRLTCIQNMVRFSAHEGRTKCTRHKLYGTNIICAFRGIFVRNNKWRKLIRNRVFFRPTHPSERYCRFYIIISYLSASIFSRTFFCHPNCTTVNFSSTETESTKLFCKMKERSIKETVPNLKQIYRQ